MCVHKVVKLNSRALFLMKADFIVKNIKTFISYKKKKISTKLIFTDQL